jgi:hypothetical protein
VSLQYFSLNEPRALLRGESMQVCVKSSLKWSILRSVKTLRNPIHNREASGEPPLTIFYPSHSYSLFLLTIHKLNHQSASSTIHIPLPSSHPSNSPHAEPPLCILYHPHSSSFFSFLLTIHKLNHHSPSSTIRIPLPSSHSFS